ncbi:MAG TPA: succinate dehydrogenase, cytochrome b556 subunit [Candidatus Thiothrix moscowensis]|uniref:succinate dehydrogenase, cytochrome b556 subunit n=1 Tax=unclassified Thiothrix TaxID=2636184 RepID=UPI0025F33646|nr:MULTISPECIES: succinate dehydrogenase, cytochrome b556 subunit [unclassified Thiothrix]HRJ54315.1 succinate dehydrogenase, cytochrome b556 subunit [Candidatus Thiothrix moscowensis]HRJ94610.1 succinate dehydrogenase, cytochrome b556 subunit [Candidatus Thiothrix moscowensis]
MKNTQNRPMSPHLQIYKPQITSVLSILHRGTGIVLAVGTLLVTYWLSALAGGVETFNAANAILGSFLGKVVLFGWTWALFYHLSNGIRHLMWDTGFGFDLPTVYLSGKIVVGASFVLTVLLWIVA